MHVCLRVYARVCLCVYVLVCMCVYAHVSMCANACVYVCMRANACVRGCLCVYAHVSMCVYARVDVRVYKHMHAGRRRSLKEPLGSLSSAEETPGTQGPLVKHSRQQQRASAGEDRRSGGQEPGGCENEGNLRSAPRRRFPFKLAAEGARRQRRASRGPSSGREPHQTLNINKGYYAVPYRLKSAEVPGNEPPSVTRLRAMAFYAPRPVNQKCERPASLRGLPRGFIHRIPSFATRLQRTGPKAALLRASDGKLINKRGTRSRATLFPPKKN